MGESQIGLRVSLSRNVGLIEVALDFLSLPPTTIFYSQ